MKMQLLILLSSLFSVVSVQSTNLLKSNLKQSALASRPRLAHQNLPVIKRRPQILRAAAASFYTADNSQSKAQQNQITQSSEISHPTQSPTTVLSQVPLTSYFNDISIRLISSTSLIADSVEYKNPELFKISKELFDSTHKYHNVMLFVRDTLNASSAKPLDSKVSKFNKFLEVVHYTEMLAIDSDIKYLVEMRPLKAQSSLSSMEDHISFKVGSDALLKGVKKQLDVLLL